MPVLGWSAKGSQGNSANIPEALDSWPWEGQASEGLLLPRGPQAQGPVASAESRSYKSICHHSLRSVPYEGSSSRDGEQPYLANGTEHTQQRYMTGCHLAKGVGPGVCSAFVLTSLVMLCRTEQAALKCSLHSGLHWRCRSCQGGQRNTADASQGVGDTDGK